MFVNMNMKGNQLFMHIKTNHDIKFRGLIVIVLFYG